MSFDIQTIQLISLDASIPPNQRLLITTLNSFDSQSIVAEQLASLLGLSKPNLVKSLQALTDSKLVQHSGNGKIIGEYNGQFFTVNLSGIHLGAVRRAHTNTITDKARIKLDQLRLVGFVGTDGLIAKLSRDYDNAMIKFTGISARSIPPNFQRAIKSKNWVHFKRLHQLLVDRQFASVQYLESQFKAMQSNKKAGKVYPYPGMLYSTWAINNYLTVVKDSMCRETSENLFMSEDSIIREVLTSSIDIVSQLSESNPELTQLQAVLLSQDSVSPLYLALHQDYLKFILKYEQDAPDDVMRILLRFEKDPEFKKLVKSIFNELHRRVQCL